MAFVDGGLTVIGGFLGKGQALSKGIKKKKILEQSSQSVNIC